MAGRPKYIQRGTRDHIKRLRKKKNLSQQGLADLMDTTMQTVKRIELGNQQISEDQARAMGEVFDVPFYLLYDEQATEVFLSARAVKKRPEDLILIRVMTIVLEHAESDRTIMLTAEEAATIAVEVSRVILSDPSPDMADRAITNMVRTAIRMRPPLQLVVDNDDTPPDQAG